MNKNISKFVEEVLLESTLDSRIDDGIVDLTNIKHIEVIHEVLKNKGLEDDGIEELFETMLAQEGKYPDRQAYNKEGWLVTFPSKEYRDAAIKRGTHAMADPTHGKGGMNLYYKKRGKQRRQTQQQATSVGGSNQSAATQAQVPATKTTTATPSGKAGSAQQPTLKQTADTAAQPTKQEKEPLPPDEGEPLTNKEIEKIKQDAAQTYQKKTPQTTGQQAPAIADTPEKLQTHASSVKKDITEKFAQYKNWSPTQYGEWRDKDGQTKAVVSLSGEVAPINSNDREELKLFAEKNTT